MANSWTENSLVISLSRCAMNRRDGGERYVLVIDEYETLFGRSQNCSNAES